MDGTELKMLRVKRSVRSIDLANKLGVSPARIAQIEGHRSERVSDEWTTRYIKALNDIQDEERSIKDHEQK